jgi:hypothetical protein
VLAALAPENDGLARFAAAIRVASWDADSDCGLAINRWRPASISWRPAKEVWEFAPDHGASSSSEMSRSLEAGAPPAV